MLESKRPGDGEENYVRGVSDVFEVVDADELWAERGFDFPSRRSGARKEFQALDVDLELF